MGLRVRGDGANQIHLEISTVERGQMQSAQKEFEQPLRYMELPMAYLHSQGIPAHQLHQILELTLQHDGLVRSGK